MALEMIPFPGLIRTGFFCCCCLVQVVPYDRNSPLNTGMGVFIGISKKCYIDVVIGTSPPDTKLTWTVFGNKMLYHVLVTHLHILAPYPPLWLF